MHYGFWDDKTKNRQQAILNENREVVRLGRIKKNMRILDAGCGVGGTAIYIAKHTGAKIWGITIDPNQVRLATFYAKKSLYLQTQTFQRKTFQKQHFQIASLTLYMA